MKKATRDLLYKFYKDNATTVKTLDLGSAAGRNKEYFPNSITVDIDPNAHPDIVADAHDLPFPDNSFECVVAKEMLEHVKDPKKVISEFRRVLKPGGKIVLSTRFLFPIHEAPNDHWRFTVYCLKELFKDWSNVTIKEESDPITCFVILIQRLVYQSEFRFNKITKGLLVLFAYAMVLFKPLLTKQYGDVGKTKEIESAFTSGYYLVAYK